MHRILFAHPDEKLSLLYCNHLKPHFLVDSAHDGLTALRKFKAAPPSMIVCDYELPIISGISMLRFVREHPVHNRLPFIFLTAYHDNRQALTLGANDWIDLKISHPNILLDHIYNHLKLNRYVQIN